MLAEQAATETSAAEVGVVTSADLFRFCLFHNFSSIFVLWLRLKARRYL